MQPRNRFAYAYLIIGAAVLLGWPFVQNYFWPPPPKKPTERDLVAFAGGSLADTALRIDAPGLAQLEKEREFLSRGRLEPVMSVLGGLSIATTPVQELTRAALTEYRESALLAAGGPLGVTPAAGRGSALSLRLAVTLPTSQAGLPVALRGSGSAADARAT